MKIDSPNQPLPDPNQVTIPTPWKNPPSLKDLTQDFEQAKPQQQAHMLRVQEWNDLLNIQGKAKPPTRKGRSSVQPKLVRRQAEWRYSALTEPFTGNDKVFKITPVTFEDADAARQNELVLNWQFRTKLNRIKFVDDFVRSTVDEGTSIVRVGWIRITTMLKKMVPTFDHFEITDEAQLEALQAAVELRSENPRAYDEQIPDELKAAVEYLDDHGIPTVAVQNGEEEVEYEHVVKNQPTVTVKDPRNIYIDPSCEGDFDKAMFVVEAFETCKADLEKSGINYHNLDKVNWADATPITATDYYTGTPNPFQFSDTARKKIVAYEYWGKWDVEGDGNLVNIVATWIGGTLVRMEENPYPDEKFPYVVTSYLPVKRELYGEPDAELLKENQAIAGAVTRGMIDSLGRSANAQMGIAKGMLDTANKRKFDNGEDYEWNNNGTSNPQAGIIEHKYPELPQAAMAMLQLMNADGESLTGVKSFSGGMSGEALGDVAAGIRGMLDAASKREMAILRRMALGISMVGIKICAMNGAWMSESETVRVTNKEFVEITREELAGNFDIIVDISTAEVDNAKAQDLAFMLQTVGPKADMAITMMILAEIAELKRMPELAQKLRTFRPEPSPQEQEMMQLEIEIKKAELDKIRAEAEKLRAEARAAGSKADKTDLDYVEQESGTAHERKMAEQRAQAQANQDYAITAALAKPTKENEKPGNIDAAIGYSKLSENNGAMIPSAPSSVISRDQSTDPATNLGSQQWDPRMDPATNPALNF